MVEVQRAGQVLDGVADDGVFPDEIRDDFARLPQGPILWKIGTVLEELLETKNGQKKVIKAELQALAPTMAVGQSFTKFFWVGTKDDPTASQKVTWTFNAARNFKMMAAKAGVAIEGKSRSVIYSELQGREVIGKISYPPRQDGGNAMAEIQEWYEVGSVPLEVTAAPPRQSQPQGAVPAPSFGARPAGVGAPPPPTGIPGGLKLTR